MQHISFTRGAWAPDAFLQVYSPISRAYVPFTQEEDAIMSGWNASIGDFDYISIVTPDRHPVGTRITTRCTFDKYGAPIIVLTDDIAADGEGRLRYGLHFEVVAWEEGCNVWHIVPWPEHTERPIRPTLIGSMKFPIPGGSPVDMEVTLREGALDIVMNGHTLTVTHPDIPRAAHVGITGCEGVNRFSFLEIE